jgi:DNA-binding CsgD family transcriptional regulator
MIDLLLSSSEQRAVRALVAAEPVSGMLPCRQILAHVAVLIPCDSVAVEVADPKGFLVDSICLARAQHGRPQWRAGEPRAGIVHKALDPRQHSWLAAHGLTDELVLGLRDHGAQVVQLSLVRRERRFSERDSAVLRMIAPALERTLRSLPAPTPPATLTVQERRVLQLVATGLSNTEIADRLYVAPCTVRKHLEHAFRKLGVTNRLAAVIAFERHHRVGREPRGRPEKYA